MTGPGRLLRAALLLALVVRLALFGTADHTRMALRLRLLLQQLGGAWVKLGQTLALRHDMLPTIYCAEFARLLDQVPPFDATEAIRIVEDQLGAPLAKLFTRFDRQPIASASTGQVHRAWHGELPLAVKVQRPGIERRFRADFALMRLGAWIGDLLGLGRGLVLREFVAEFAAWTWRELDYREEAFSARMLRANARGAGIEAHVESLPAERHGRDRTDEA